MTFAVTARLGEKFHFRFVRMDIEEYANYAHRLMCRTDCTFGTGGRSEHIRNIRDFQRISMLMAHTSPNIHSIYLIHGDCRFGLQHHKLSVLKQVDIKHAFMLHIGLPMKLGHKWEIPSHLKITNVITYPCIKTTYSLHDRKQDMLRFVSVHLQWSKM